MDEEPDKYQSHFSEYIKKGIEPESIEEMYKKVHAAIRADPTVKKSEKQPPKEHKRYVNFLIYFCCFWVCLYMLLLLLSSNENYLLFHYLVMLFESSTSQIPRIFLFIIFFSWFLLHG
jgi:hypothetical protein